MSVDVPTATDAETEETATTEADVVEEEVTAVEEAPDLTVSTTPVPEVDGADDAIAGFQQTVDEVIESADFDDVGEATLADCPLTTWQELAPGASVNLESNVVELVQSSADDGSDVFPPLVRCRFDLDNGGTVFLDAFQEPYDTYNGKPFAETLMLEMGGEGVFTGPTDVTPSGVVYGYCENDGSRCAATWVSGTTQLSLLGPADFGASGEYAAWMAAFINRKFG
ncbi:MAG TPA: hypothetical protein PK020_06340 [Ilumatobacteraceae bacterium]|nr:hypothetical protein [Ilumatobacteraceae bacterium]HRB04035.1 hypothetical protein [Ilumatobacteraceae bacterium]